MTRLFQSVPEEDLDVAVLKNDLVLSQAQTKRVMEYAQTIASNRTGMPVKLRSYDAINRAVEKACDRSIDAGVMRSETYTLPESKKPVKGVPKVVDFKWQDVIHWSSCLPTLICLPIRLDTYGSRKLGKGAVTGS